MAVVGGLIAAVMAARTLVEPGGKSPTLAARGGGLQWHTSRDGRHG